ncbi:uncharacterized protein [Haliotis cracherodii]|uniref:uncharacterized protein n=1 Tax=Haliotis cracherodii TaxID=6455 RepID=UPI0039E9299F
MKEVLIVFAVTAFAVCDGRVLSAPRLAQDAALNSGTSRNGHMGAVASGLTGGAPLQEYPYPPACFPNTCPIYTITATASEKYETRQYPAGKWLKASTQPYDVRHIESQDIIDYIISANSLNKTLQYAVPVVVKVDVPLGHAAVYKRLMAQMSSVGVLMQQKRNEIIQQLTELQQQHQHQQPHQLMVELQKRMQPMKQQYRTLTAGIYSEFTTFSHNYNMTLYLYLHPDYHQNTPIPTNPNVTIVDSPGFSVYAKGYMDVNAASSYDMALNVSSAANVEFSSYYFVDYLQRYNGLNKFFYHEVWLSTDPTRPVL